MSSIRLILYAGSIYEYNENTTRNSDETARVGRFLIDASSIRMGDRCGLPWVRARVYTRFQGGFRSTHSANLNSPVIVVDAEVTAGGKNWMKYEGRKVNDCGSNRSRRWVIAERSLSWVAARYVTSLARAPIVLLSVTNEPLSLARKGLKGWAAGLAWVAFPSAERNKSASNWTERRHGARIQWRIETATSSGG